MNRTVYVLLPAYNEAPSLKQLIPDLLTSLRAQGESPQICVVDDGSHDTTAQVLTAFGQEPVTRVAHEQNRGYGAALRTGYAWCLKQGKAGDVVVSMDADCTHPPEFIARLLQKVDGGADVVTASYELQGGHVSGVPPVRRLMSRVINGLFRFLAPIAGANTYTNGFRCYTWAVLQKTAQHFGENLITETGFPGGVELFLKVARQTPRVDEVPFDLHYERRGADSKIRLVETIRRYLALLWKSRTWN